MACIKKWDSKDTLFLIDPPWDIKYYDSSGKMEGASMLNQFERGKRKLGSTATSSFIDRTVKQYIKDLESLLPTLQGTFIVTLGNRQNIKSLYSKLITYPGKVMFSFNPKTMMFSNRPLKIQIPQITEFLKC